MNRRSTVTTGNNETQETANSARETDPLMDPQSSHHISSDLFSGFPSQGAHGVTLHTYHGEPATPVDPRIDCYTYANGVGREESQIYSHHALIPDQRSDDQLSNGPIRLDHSLHNNTQHYTNYYQEEIHSHPSQQRAETQDFCFHHQFLDELSFRGAMRPTGKNETLETANSARETNQLMDSQSSHHISSDLFSGFLSQGAHDVTLHTYHGEPATPVNPRIDCYTYANGVGREESQIYSHHALIPDQRSDGQLSYAPMRSDHSLHNNTQYYSYYYQKENHSHPSQQRAETPHQSLDELSSLGAMRPYHNVYNNTRYYPY